MSTRSRSHAKQRAAHKPATNQRSVLWIALAVVIVVGAAGVLLLRQSSSGGNSGTPPEISIKEAAAKRDAGAFILDVREPDEWADFHVPGSTLIPLGSLPDRLKEVPRDKEIVVVCRSGNRSTSGRDILLNAGFSRVTSMAGGLREWQTQGYPVVSGQ
ncbi:MAG: rhodanese-like domain-containing protein [Anaerolineae bacterium]|nr:rhodanese-like domain-containing protein [Anaerolineae bacterium]